MNSLRSTALLWILSICIVLTIVNYYTLRTTSAVRAYITGESQYSKGQKDGTNHLVLYISTGEKQYWKQFQEDLSIPIGDSLARVALLSNQPDSIVKAGFLQGRNHPHDLDKMIWLFKNFKDVSFMRAAIQIWTEGDKLNGRLLVMGEHYHYKMQTNSFSLEEQIVAIKSINQLSGQLTTIEERFSNTLGDTARVISRLLFMVNTALIILLIGLGGRFSIRSIKKLATAKKLRDNLMNEAFESFIWYDQHSVITFWNAQAEKTFGWTREEMIGKKLTDTVIPEKFAAQHKANIRDFLHVGKPPLPRPRLETVALHKDGSEIDIELSILAITEGQDVLFCAHIFDITDEKKRKTLENKRASYLHAILNSTDDGILATSVDGEIIEANQRFADLWGIPLSEISNAKYQTVAKRILVQINDAEEIITEVRRLFVTHEIHTRLVYCKDGKIYERHSMPMILDGELLGRVWSFRDMTSKITLENQEKKRATYLHAILNSTDDGILATTKDGIILEANQRFIELWKLDSTGISIEDHEKVAEHVLNQVDDPEEIVAELLKLYESDKVHTRIVHCKDGRIFDRHSVPMVLEGETIGRVWSFRDVTGKVKAESDYKNIFEYSADGIYIANLTGSYRAVNPMMAKMYGYESPEEMIEMITDSGKQQVVNQEDLEVMRVAMETMGYANGIEFQARKKNGDIFWVRNHMRLITDKNGNPTQVEGSIEDITERKMAQDQLLSQLEEVKKVNFELDRFVYSVSHDLRAPLLSIKGLVNISEMEEPPAAIMQYLDLIRTSVDRLDKFIMDILDYSRNSRLEMQQNTIDFNQIIAEIENNMSHMEGFNRLKSIERKISLSADFVSDKRRIQVIFNNLISNAIKYQDYNKKDAEVIIEIFDNVSSNELTIRITDNGIGISDSNQEKIFDMFYRASDRSKGAGLGLYIIKETVDKLNGNITLTSTPEAFTCFEIILPLGVTQSKKVI